MELDYKTEEDAARYQFLREGGLSCLEHGLLDSELVFATGVDLDDEVDFKRADFVGERSRDLKTDALRYRFLRDGNIARLECVADEYGILDFYSYDALDQEVDDLILSAAR
jgi:hypothetical protein